METNEFKCDTTLMVEFIQRLTDATRLHRICWHSNDNNSCYIFNSTPWRPTPLDKFSILFTFDKEKDAIRIFLDDLHKTYTPADVEVWEHLKELEWQVQESLRSIEATLHSMMEALSNKM